MREVVMPPPERQSYTVTVPDGQCGHPVLDGRDGNTSYHPCMKAIGHTGQHSDYERCPQTFIHAWGGEQTCTEIRWHVGRCRNARYVAQDVYGEGDEK
jgi:hypothetical protein